MDKVILTGSNGFIGKSIFNHLQLSGNYSISSFSISKLFKDLSKLSNYVYSFIQENKDAKFFIHCAGQSSVGISITEPSADFISNTFIVNAILDAIRIINPKIVFVFLSSAAVFGNQNAIITEKTPKEPISPYGFSKLNAENLCNLYSKIYQVQTIIIRPFSVYGPHLSRQVIYDTINKFLSKKPILLHGTGNEARDFVYVDDLAEFVLFLLKNSDKHVFFDFNFASGVSYSIATIANKIQSLLGSTAEIGFNQVVDFGTPLHWDVDVSKLNATGFKLQTTLDSGLEKTIQWCIREKEND